MVLSLPLLLLGFIGGTWAIGVTVVIIVVYRSFSRLTAGTKKDRLDEVLEQLSSELRQEKQSYRRIEKEFFSLKETLPEHLQKIGLVRYNPFPGTGGDQSFSLAILNGRGSGLVITSLHSREGTRLYAKPIRAGAGQINLSREEQEALKAAEGR